MKNNIVILGAGVSGIAAADRLLEEGINSVVFEKEGIYGGLCGSFTIDGFTFDTFAHISFDNSTKKWLEDTVPHYVHQPAALNYDRGRWLKNPVQNNLFRLSVDERIKIVKGFINRDISIIPKNYEEWLIKTYGQTFYEEYPARYTKKYWTVEASELEPHWIKGRMYEPTLDEVLYGALLDVTPEVHYSKEARYPENGGFMSFLTHMANNCHIEYNKEVISIDPVARRILFKDGTAECYDILISTIPLPELCSMITDLPLEIRNAAAGLDYTSGVMVSLGFNRKCVAPSLWFYIYDEDIMPARVYSSDWKSHNNVPEGCSAIQAEIYFSKYRPLNVPLDKLLEISIMQLLELGLFYKKDIIVKDIRVKSYANVMFTPAIYKNRDIIHKYLDEIGINYAGRFGEWDYLWTGQSLMSGRKTAENIIYNNMLRR